MIMDKEKYTDQEKEQFFVERTKNKYPEVWNHYTSHIAHELMTEQELDQYNFSKRVEIVKYAYENTSFYKELYDKAGFHPSQLKTEMDWNRIPTIDKQMVRENFSQMLVGGINGELVKKYGKVCNTGGSTGEPLSLIRDTRYDQPGSIIWRSRGWWLGRPLGNLFGPRPILGQNEGFIWRMNGLSVKDESKRLSEKKAYWPMQRFYLDAQNMTTEAMLEFARDIDRNGVTYLRGYAGALVEFAQFCIENGISCYPKICSVVSNPIDAIGRRIIQEGLHCDAFDVYGSNECQNMAHECAQSEHNLHVLSDLRHLEILDEQQQPIEDESEGVVYITSFTNFIMPLIRYRQGDRTNWIKKTCKCGLPFPLIHRIKGRESNWLVDKNGQKVFAVTSPFFDVPNFINGYQYVVHAPGKVTIKINPNKKNPDFEKGIEYIKDSYSKQYGNRFDFTYEIVDSIPHDDGKLRIIVFEK